jgi:segregation and condensation protein B
MSLKAQVEAIIYAAEEPVTVEQIAAVLKENASANQDAPHHESPEQLGPVLVEGQPENGEPKKPRKPDALASLKGAIRQAINELASDYASPDRGIEVRAIAGGYRMATKPEHHDAVRGFARSLKPPVRLSMPALETLAVIAYKQPITVPEFSEIRGVDSGGVIATLLDRKLISTAGRKQVIGRPILYKTTREFLLRFGLKDVNELPSMEEFEKLMNEAAQEELLPAQAVSSGQDQTSSTEHNEPDSHAEQENATING